MENAVVLLRRDAARRGATLSTVLERRGALVGLAARSGAPSGRGGAAEGRRETGTASGRRDCRAAEDEGGLGEKRSRARARQTRDRRVSWTSEKQKCISARWPSLERLSRLRDRRRGTERRRRQAAGGCESPVSRCICVPTRFALNFKRGPRYLFRRTPGPLGSPFVEIFGLDPLIFRRAAPFAGFVVLATVLEV